MTVAASRSGGTATAWLLTLCFVMAQADKQVLGLLAAPIQDDFHLTNVQLGLLQGGAFALAYAVGGLPIARLLDSGPRIRIAAICVLLWSFATLGSGLAGSFAVLVVCRAATAFAEAGLPPAAFSVFAQSDDRTAAKAITGFMLAPFVGGGLVLVLGGLLLRALDGSTYSMPGWSEPWRVVLLAVGAPGLVLAALLAFVGREPPRADRGAARSLPSMGQVVRTIFVETRHLRYYYIGATCFYALVAALIAWYPTLLVREYGVMTATAGGYAGLTFLVGGIAGTLAANVLTRMRAAIELRRILGDFLLAAILLVPIVAAIPIVSGINLSVGLYALYAFVSAAIVSALPIPIQMSLPDAMRARGTAIASLLMSGLAGTAGPYVVGMLIDRGGLPLSVALSVTVGTAATLAVAFFAIARTAARGATSHLATAT